MHAGGRGREESRYERVPVSTGGEQARKGVVCCAGRPPVEPALDGEAHQAANPEDQSRDKPCCGGVGVSGFGAQTSVHLLSWY